MKFRGQHWFLSNFYPAPITPGEGFPEHVQGKEFPTSEHLYQALKCSSPEQAEIIRKMKTPGDTKRYGRRVEIRPDWIAIREEVMKKVCTLKFQTHADLEEKLIATIEPIIEENHWNDTFWGVCNGKGKNVLGRILEEIRKQIEGEN